MPYGETVSYAELANMWGESKAARAAGSACREIPSHRFSLATVLTGSDGRYDNYSGGMKLDSPAMLPEKAL